MPGQAAGQAASRVGHPAESVTPAARGAGGGDAVTGYLYGPQDH